MSSPHPEAIQVFSTIHLIRIKETHCSGNSLEFRGLESGTRIKDKLAEKKATVGESTAFRISVRNQGQGPSKHFFLCYVVSLHLSLLLWSLMVWASSSISFESRISLLG